MKQRAAQEITCVNSFQRNNITRRSNEIVERGSEINKKIERNGKNGKREDWIEGIGFCCGYRGHRFVFLFVEQALADHFGPREKLFYALLYKSRVDLDFFWKQRARRLFQRSSCIVHKGAGFSWARFSLCHDKNLKKNQSLVRGSAEGLQKVKLWTLFNKKN